MRCCATLSRAILGREERWSTHPEKKERKEAFELDVAAAGRKIMESSLSSLLSFLVGMFLYIVYS